MRLLRVGQCEGRSDPRVDGAIVQELNDGPDIPIDLLAMCFYPTIHRIELDGRLPEHLRERQQQEQPNDLRPIAASTGLDRAGNPERNQLAMLRYE
jgi:hypothetical protein